jgi:hypothetical protein
MSRRGQVGVISLGVVVLIAGVAGAALLLTSAGSGASALSSSSLTPPATVAPAVQQFPKPPAGAFVTAREDGSDVLALAVGSKPAGVELQVSDVTQDGVGARGLKVSFAVTSKGATATRSATVCGAGCYHATVPLASRPQQVTVRVTRPARTTSWKVALPATWPAQDASAIVARATRTWKQLRSVRYHERLASDPVHAVESDWQIVAPDRLSYQIQGEGQAVIVGVHRWDRQKGGDWVETSALRLHQPEPFWVEVTNAHVVDSATVQGHRVWRVSFFDPRTPGWFLAAIDEGTYRTLDVHMTATAHFMHDSYGGFNTSIKIDPPTAS